MKSNLTEGNIENYKGVHFETQVKEKYYECGAHFSFNEICKKLNDILNKKYIKSMTYSKKLFFIIF